LTYGLTWHDGTFDARRLRPPTGGRSAPASTPQGARRPAGAALDSAPASRRSQVWTTRPVDENIGSDRIRRTLRAARSLDESMQSSRQHFDQAMRALAEAQRAPLPGQRERWLQLAAGWQALGTTAFRRELRWAELTARSMLAKLFPGQFDPWSPLPLIDDDPA